MFSEIVNELDTYLPNFNLDYRVNNGILVIFYDGFHLITCDKNDYQPFSVENDYFKFYEYNFTLRILEILFYKLLRSRLYLHEINWINSLPIHVLKEFCIYALNIDAFSEYIDNIHKYLELIDKNKFDSYLYLEALAYG